MVLNSKDSTFTKRLNETLSKGFMPSPRGETMTTTIFQQQSTMCDTKGTLNFSREPTQTTTFMHIQQMNGACGAPGSLLEVISELDDEVNKDPNRITASFSLENGALINQKSKMGSGGGSNGPNNSKKISEELKNEYSRSKKSSSDNNSQSIGEPFISPPMTIRQSRLEKFKSNMLEAVDLILSQGRISLGEDSQFIMAALDSDFFKNIDKKLVST